ncbi:MAG TPA: anti-sigma factor RsbA family regulatory protein [Actinoplanes sp.]|nr:anti-sigma factor RsbA family regulatory protein [Actinoplanes sp.]
MRNSGAAHLSHSAFFYDSADEYAGFLQPFISEGLERGESIAMAAARPRIALLREALGPDAAAVRFLPADEWYVRPVRTIGGWTKTLRTAAATGRPVARLINEVDFHDPHPSWVRYESALNASLAPFDAHVLCPYDRLNLPLTLIDAARRTHHRVHDGGWHHSDEYVEPERLLADLDEPAFPAKGDPIVEVSVVDTVADLRAHLRNRASSEGWLPPDRIEVLVLALSEVATNGIRHGGSRRALRVWLNPEAVVCEVTDDGSRPPGPLAGYLPPTPGVVGGMGLWLVGQICDSLSVHTTNGVTHARFALRR